MLKHYHLNRSNSHHMLSLSAENSWGRWYFYSQQIRRFSLQDIIISLLLSSPPLLHERGARDDNDEGILTTGRDQTNNFTILLAPCLIVRLVTLVVRFTLDVHYYFLFAARSNNTKCQHAGNDSGNAPSSARMQDDSWTQSSKLFHD